MHTLEKDETKSGGNFRDEVLCVRSCSRSGYAPGAKKQKTTTTGHNGYERGDQSFCSCLVLSSQLSHSAPEFDQYVEPDADEAPRNEHERLSKHPGTGTLTYTHTRTFFLFHVSVSHNLSLLCFGQKGSKHKNQQCTHTPAVPLPTPLQESHSSQ